MQTAQGFRVSGSAYLAVASNAAMTHCASQAWDHLSEAGAPLQLVDTRQKEGSDEDTPPQQGLQTTHKQALQACSAHCCRVHHHHLQLNYRVNGTASVINKVHP